MPQIDRAVRNPFPPQWRTALLCVLLGAITLAAFWPVVGNDFIGLDDGVYVTHNPPVAGGLTWANVRWAFTAGHTANWHPLTWLSHMLDVQLFGLRPWGHHLTNLLLHTANTLLLFLLLRTMTRPSANDWRCAWVAALFAVHPLHVESVAWVAERKDVLSTFFFLLALGAYTRYARERLETPATRRSAAVAAASSGGVSPPGPTPGGTPGELAGETPALQNPVSAPAPCPSTPAPRHPPLGTLSFLLALAWFAFGLMSKPMLVTLPFLLLLLDFWPLGRITLSAQRSTLVTFRRLLREKLPFFALSIVSSIVTFQVQRHGHALSMQTTFATRLANAIASYWKYLGKTVWPSNLAVFYPYSTPHVAGSTPWPGWLVWGAGLGLIAISVWVWLRRDQRPWWVTGWFWYLGTLVPVIGLVQAGGQAMADRYSYVPLIGIFICVAWTATSGAGAVSRGERRGASELTRSRVLLQREALAGLAVVVVLGCVAMTRHQVKYWRNNLTLFGHALEVTGANAPAHFELGAALGAQGDFAAAIEHFRAAIRDDPAYPGAYYSLGLTLEGTGHPAQAIEQYETALRLAPWSEEYHNRFGLALWAVGRQADACQQYTEALRLNTSFADAHYNLGVALFTLGKADEAVAHFKAAAHLNPNDPEALTGLGRALADQGALKEAEARYRQAMRLTPTNADPALYLGQLLLATGQTNAAAAALAEALRREPGLEERLVQQGESLAARGQLDPALARFKIALTLKPESTAANRDAAWLLATHPQAKARNGVEAARLARRALEAGGGQDPRCWAALDAAYAEAGRFAEAITAAEKTRALALAAGQTNTAQAAETRLARYRNQQPYHQN